MADLEGVQRARPHLMEQNFLNFMQFFEKIWQFCMLAPPPPPDGWCPLLWRILDPPLTSNTHNN